MALGMSMSMEMNDIPSLRAERPEIDREKLASLVDIISKASAKEPEQHDEDMLRQIYDSRLTYRKKDRLYYIGNNDLTDDYLIRLQYIGAKLGSRKVDIRTKTALKRKEIEDIVEDFASQNGVVLERAEKSIRPGAGRFNYISVKHNNNELVRIFGSKISFVHDRLKLNEDDYRLGLDLTARLIADYHEEDKIAQNIRKFDYCSYAVPLYLRIPGWYRKNYLGDLIRGFQAFIENPKDKELKIANPVQDGLINADELARKTKKYKGCYVVEDKYKKRHVSYVFGDRDKQATVKLDCNIDVFHIRNLIKKPSEVSLYGGPWIPFSEAEPALVRKAHEEKQLMSRTARGNHLLRNTKHAGLCLSLGKNNKIYHDDKELVTLGNQTIKVNARNEYSREEYELALAVANAIYEQMLYYTSSSIADRQLTCSLMEDEKMIMSEVDARAKAYMMRAELSHDWDTARRVACSDILDDAKLTALEYQKELEKVKSGELVSLESAIREYKLDPAQLKQDIEQRKVMVTKFGHLNKKQIENYK